MLSSIAIKEEVNNNSTNHMTNNNSGPDNLAEIKDYNSNLFDVLGINTSSRDIEAENVERSTRGTVPRSY